MLKPEPTYELQTDADLSKFLLGAIRDVRKKLLDCESAFVISQLSDKYIKLKVAVALEQRINERTDLKNVDGMIGKALMQKIDLSQQP